MNKEEIFGMYAALKAYLGKDHKKEWQDWLDRVKYITARVETIPSVKTETYIDTGPANAFPSMKISWDENKVKITPAEVVKALKEGEPSIVAGGRENLHVGVVLLRPEQVDIVARRVKEILVKAI